MDPDAKYMLRWRGRQSGPFTLPQIERKLAENEIGMLHEVFSDGQWVSIQQVLLQKSQTSFETPLSTPLAEARNQTIQAETADEVELFDLRWHGKGLGRMRPDEIELLLDRQEIGMLHEVFWNGRWITLNDFFVRRNLALAKFQAVSAPRKERKLQAVKQGGRMVLENVGRTVSGKLKILQEINLVIEPNEFVALLGPSGSGKSTLMNAMTGRQLATEGMIRLNGDDFYKNAWKYREQIGLVPQKDIVHLPLTVLQELTYAARLRLSTLKSSFEIEERVNTVIEQIGLQERRQTKNLSLSGGQLKRVSLGVEMLSNPQLLFLDEATSGLDAGIEARMMSLFRKLADDGRTVVCVTHNLENVCLCNLVAVLVGGRLAFYGPPLELPAYFKVEKMSQVYDCLSMQTPEAWANQFKTSVYHEKYISGRLHSGQTHGANEHLRAPVKAKSNGMLHQFFILTQRYLAVVLKDYKNIILLLVQAPIIAALIGLVFHSEDFEKLPNGPMNQKMLSFLLVVSSIWFGCINSAREIVKELPLYLRERAIGLNLVSYLASKVAVLSLFCFIQCAALLSITLLLTKFHPIIWMQTGCLLLTAFGGMLMGLLISSLVKNEDKAIAIVPILLIPQVVFAGAILKLTGAAELIAKWTVVSFWSLDAMVHSLSASARQVNAPLYRLRVDLGIMGLFLLVLTILTALALIRKDSQK